MSSLFVHNRVGGSKVEHRFDVNKRYSCCASPQLCHSFAWIGVQDSANNSLK